MALIDSRQIPRHRLTKTIVTLEAIRDGKVTTVKNVRLTYDVERGEFRKVKHAGRFHRVKKVISEYVVPW